MRQLLLLPFIFLATVAAFAQDASRYFRLDFYYFQGYTKNYLNDFNSTPTSPADFVKRAIARYILEAGTEALDDLNKAIELDSTNADAFFHRGYIRAHYYNSFKQYDHAEFSPDKALQDFSKAIRLDSSFALAYSFRGEIYGDRKQYDLALNDLNKALRLTTSEPQIFCHIAEIKKEQKKYEESIQWYKRALSTDSTYLEAYFGLDECNLRIENYSECIRALDKILELYPGLYNTYGSRAYRKIKNKDYEGACADHEIYSMINREQRGSSDDSFSKKYCKNSKAPDKPIEDPAKKSTVNICDTLYIWQDNIYCVGGIYFPDSLNPTTAHLCRYRHWTNGINRFIAQHKDEIKVIILENPSNTLPYLELKDLRKLKGIFMHGNEYNCDAIKTLPSDLLNLPALKEIHLSGVRFPSDELERLKKAYPNIEFPDWVSEYMKEWDQSLKR